MNQWRITIRREAKDDIPAKQWDISVLSEYEDVSKLKSYFDSRNASLGLSFVAGRMFDPKEYPEWAIVEKIIFRTNGHMVYFETMRMPNPIALERPKRPLGILSEIMAQPPYKYDGSGMTEEAFIRMKEEYWEALRNKEYRRRWRSLVNRIKSWLK